jgi:hypothetical protein
MSNYRIQGATGEWEIVIGLEFHAQAIAIEERGVFGAVRGVVVMDILTAGCY